MKFGILLLVLIAALSAVGSVIQQGQDAAFYAANYGRFHGLILMLNLNNIYKSWYFALLLGLLCVNLTLCSVVRIRGVVKSAATASEAAANTPDTVLLSGAELEKLREHLRSKGCREEKFGNKTVFSRRNIGRYGTFITHLAILLTVIFGAGALYLPQTSDRTCFPGESVFMKDGTEIYVSSFRIEDETGKLDFTSEIEITLPNGRKSGVGSISVNHPMSFGSYKVYQQTYGTAGSVSVIDEETGAVDDFTLDEVSFLSADGVNGLWYEAVYPGYIRDEDGTMTLITSTAGSYPDPVYQVLLASEGEFTPVLAFPGESLKVDGLEFMFNEPVEYPGLRIKYTPSAVNALLCVSFLLMIAGLYITFFLPPVLVKTDGEGYAVCGPKPEYTRIELELLFEREENGE